MTRRIVSALIPAALLLTCICIPGWAEAPRKRIAAPRPAVVQTARRELTQRQGPELVSLGTFTAYAYCQCEKCCGYWSGGPTASGTMPEAGRTVAADWSVIPAGTEIYIDSLGWRTVEDTGSGITGDKLDIFMESHQAALEWGVRELEVWERP